ncbi:MAG TPA: hypothetical protein VJ608_15360 [Albitalea sp.]|nr:hypothetical protein [Albitalea sp.]
MKQLQSVRKEHVDDVDQWHASHAGDLQWVEMIEETPARRIDKLTYTANGEIEFVLCVDNRYSTALIYFAEDFTGSQAMDFLGRDAFDFMEKLQALRHQVVAAETARAADRPRR